LCQERACLRCTLAQGTPPQAWRLAPGWMASCLAGLDAVLAPSRFTLERHRAWLEEHHADAPLELLPGYSPPLGPPGSLPPGVPERFLLYAGRLTEAKGIARLIEAMARRPAMTLVVAGAGELEERLRARALPNVRLVGSL